MANETVFNNGSFDSGSSAQTRLGGDATSAHLSSTRVSSLALRPVPLDFTSVDGRHFVLDCSTEIGSGGEAIVVKATSDNGRSYAAKIGFIQQMDRSNTEDILELLSNRTATQPEAYRTDHLMPTITWGTIFAQPLGFRTQTELLVSIMPVCKSLEDVDLEPSFVKNAILPQLAEALHFLHQNNIVHRDVKPANVYEYNGTIVLGDFGISTVLEQGENVRDTRMNRRTPGYTPNQNGVLKENDWYALGYTLWTMYNHGVHPYQQYIEEELQTGESAVLKQVEFGYRLVDFIPREDGDETFGQLIFGLTSSSRVGRLGYDDIQRYLRNPSSFRYIDEGDPSARRAIPYTFEGVTCRDNSSLAVELSRKWDSAIRHLYSRNLGNHFAKNDDNDLSTRLYDIVENDRDTVSNQDLGLARAIWYISGDAHALCWKGMDVSFPELVTQFAEHNVSELGKYDDVFTTGLLSWSLQQSGDSRSIELSRAVSVVEEAFTYNSHFGRCVFQHTFSSGGQSKWSGDTDYDSHASRVLASPCSVYDVAQSTEEIDDLLASFAGYALEKGELPALISARRAMPRHQHDPVDVVSQILTIIDEIGGGCVPAREFAINYGPMGGWLWVAIHSSEYICEGVKAKELLSEIAGEQPSTIDSVTRIAQRGDHARHLCDEFFQYIDETPLPTYLGYQTDSIVHPRSADAYICSKFFGERVPRGFVRNLLSASDKNAWGSDSYIMLVSKECRQSSSEDNRFAKECVSYIEKCKESAVYLGNSSRFTGAIVLSIAMIALAIASITVPDINKLIVEPVRESFKILSSPFGDQIKSKDFVRACALSVMAFFSCNAIVSWLSQAWSRSTESLLSECESLRDQGRYELARFSSGTSELSLRFSSSNWNGPIEPLGLIGQMDGISSRALVRTGLFDSGWYKLIWTLTTVLPAMLVPLAISPDIAKTAPEWSTNLYEELFSKNTSDFVPLQPEGTLGFILIGLLFAYLFTMYKLTKANKRSGGLWIAQVLGSSLVLAIAVGIAALAVGVIYALLMLLAALIGAVLGLAGIALVIAIFIGALSS